MFLRQKPLVPRVSRLAAFASAALLFLPLTSGAAAQGEWVTENGNARVVVAPCADAPSHSCGHMVWLEEPTDDDGNPKRDANNPEPELQNRLLIGETPIVWSMQPKDDGRSWEGGNIYDPENGRTYRARMELVDADTLDIRGYVGRPIFGRTTTWARWNPEE